MKVSVKKIFAVIMSCMLILVFSACDSSEGNKDALSGNKWETSSGMMLDLKKDGTFRWYNHKENRKNNYYSGNFTVRSGQEAIDFIAEDQGFPEESQRSAMVQFSVPDDCYYAIVFNNKECIQDGKNTLEKENEIAFYGYYQPDYEKLKIYSLDNLNPYEFTKM